MQYKGFIEKIELKVLIGLHKWEREKPQPVLMNIEYKINNSMVAITDDINDTLNYQKLVDHLKSFAEQSKYQLIETLAYNLLLEVDDNFKLDWIKIRLAKTSVIECADSCGVEVERNYATQ